VKGRNAETGSDTTDLTPLDTAFSTNATPVNPSTELFPDQTPRSQDTQQFLDMDPSFASLDNTASSQGQQSQQIPQSEQSQQHSSQQAQADPGESFDMNGYNTDNHDSLLQALGNYGQSQETEQPFSANQMMFEGNGFEFDVGRCHFTARWTGG